MALSTIEWTDATWNPVRGCSKISPGCKHCYAETFAERFRGTPGHPYERGFDLRLAPDKLTEPLTWQRPRLVFANSMSDLFHADVPEGYILDIARVMTAATWHTFQVLTKRAERMCDLLRDCLLFAAQQRHIWWGVSVEDRRYGLPRIEELRRSPATVKFLSVEPLLEDLGDNLDLAGIDWVIVGGESGPGARPMQREWVESILDRCRQADVPFFFKQWGGVRKSKTGRLLHGRTYDEMPPQRSAVEPSPESRKLLLEGHARRIAKWQGSDLVAIVPAATPVIPAAPPTPPQAMDLRTLRSSRNKTQVQMSQAIHITQGNVSMLERRADASVGLVRDYVEALGGELRITALFPDAEIRITQFDLRAVPPPETKIEASFDGACAPSNPGGSMALGWVIDGIAHHEYIAESPENTNNVAEYLALTRVLEHAVAHPEIVEWEIVGDSQLVVYQVTGEYRIGSPLLHPLYARVLEMLDHLRERGTRVMLRWVPRDRNAPADAATRAALPEHGIEPFERPQRRRRKRRYV